MTTFALVFVSIIFNSLQLLATLLCWVLSMLLYCFLFLTNARVLGLEILVSRGEQGFSGISVAQVVQSPFLLLQAQAQTHLLV